MMLKRIVIVGFMFFVGLMLVGQVLAITGSIGNARMILRAETGDTIDKYILVRNVNDEALNIELEAIGDLSSDITILHDKFVLEAGTEKRAEFIIKVKNVGTTQGKINVKFSPIIKGNGVGLSSTIIVIAEKGPGFFDFGGSDEEDKEDNDKDDGVDESEGGVSLMTGNVLSPVENKVSGGLDKKLVISGLFTIIIFILFLGLLMYKNNMNKSDKDDLKSKRGNSKSKKKSQVYE